MLVLYHMLGNLVERTIVHTINRIFECIDRFAAHRLIHIGQILSLIHISGAAFFLAVRHILKNRLNLE